MVQVRLSPFSPHYSTPPPAKFLRASKSGDQGMCTRGVACSGERQKPLVTSPSSFFFLKGAKHRLSVCSYPPWAPVKGGWHRVESPGQSPEWRHWGESLGSSCGIFEAGYTWAPQQPSSLRRGSPSQGKIHFLTLWDTTPPTLWKSPCHKL